MTSLSNPIGAQNIVDRFSDWVAGAANQGISWGTNAYPFGEFDGGLFGGDTNGKGIGISAGNLSNPVNAQNIYDVLLGETYTYTRIKNMRAVLVVDGGGGNNGSRGSPGTIYDGTAVAHMNNNYRTSISADRNNVYAGNKPTTTGLETMFSSMRDSYNWARGQTAYCEIHVCHASCHSSCHSSRGRR